MVSSTCSLISRSDRPPQRWMKRSASVDLPWSMWAMIEKLRMRCIKMGPARDRRMTLVGSKLAGSKYGYKKGCLREHPFAPHGGGGGFWPLSGPPRALTAARVAANRREDVRFAPPDLEGDGRPLVEAGEQVVERLR